MEMKFYVCEHCGNIVAFAKNQGVPVTCCGEVMKELVANTTDGSQEKHIPVVTIEGNKVTVKIGSIDHPMTEDHYIEWVSLQSTQGNQRKALAPGAQPEVCFMLCESDSVEAIYAYCNLHKLWKN